MRIQVKRKELRLYADHKKVIARFFPLSPERTSHLVKVILDLTEERVLEILQQTLRDFAMRHRSISKIFESSYKKVEWAVREYDAIDISEKRKLLIGAYFTHEYSIEAAAFFNPSIVEAPEQTGLDAGQKRAIVSLRATGEGHISSLVFRHLVIDADNNMELLPTARRVEITNVVKDTVFKKETFIQNLQDMDLPIDICHQVLDHLPEEFNYTSLVKAKDQVQNSLPSDSIYRLELEKLIWLADSHYELHFSLDTDITERVIFPISEFESRGIEDARFVKFTDDNGESTYYATYCAYNGLTILPKMIQTHNFYDFKVRPMHGKGAQNKNLALFPRKLNGQYVMLSRIDGINNYIMKSDRLTVWEDPILLQEPKYPWEFMQMGNCGSPIETEDGWLLITHGVGPMRRYSLGAALLDLEDPTREIGRLKEPLLMPNEEERDGYVPNVVYSCGAIINNGDLIIPYAMSDYASAFATVKLKDLTEKIYEDSRS